MGCYGDGAGWRVSTGDRVERVDTGEETTIATDQIPTVRSRHCSWDGQMSS
jgi:hypothetical protein